MSTKPANNDTSKPESGRFCGKPGRSGAPKGNANNLRHGLRGGKLPPKCGHVENVVNNLRRQLEAAVIAVKGEISIVDAAAINSVLKWERHGQLATTWLRREADKLSASDRLRFSEAIAKASDARDKNIKALGLDVTPDPWRGLYSLPGPDQNAELRDK